MRHFIPTLPVPQKESKNPKVEVFINYKEYTWSVVVGEDKDEYEGTFTIGRLTNAVGIEWYGIPSDEEVWEEIEFELIATILANLAK